MITLSKTDSAEYNITVGPRPFCDQTMLLTDQCSCWLAICADQIFTTVILYPIQKQLIAVKKVRVQVKQS